MLDSNIINERIMEFKEDVKNRDSLHIISKYFYNDYVPAAISLEDYHNLRWEIKNHFNLESIFEVFLVGSGRLGFSIKPTAQYRPFGENSDLDIVIVSKKLFLQYWKVARDSGIGLKEWKDKLAFEDYFFNGWMRPDKLQNGGQQLDVKEWWEFFGQLSRSRKYGDFSINGGLYYSLDFLEHYQIDAINRLKESEEI